MEEKDNPKEYKKNKILLLYIIGFAILLGGVRELFNGETLLGIVYILNGIILIPVTADAIVKILIRIIEIPAIANTLEKNSTILSKIIVLITNSLRCFLIFVFLLGGVGSLFMGKIIPGVVYILIGILFIPVIEDLIEKKINL